MDKITNGIMLSVEEYERLTKKKKAKTSNVILAVLGLFLLAFIVTMIVMFCKFQTVPDTLIENVLDATKWEAGVLAFITISKVVRDGFGNKKESEE